MDRYVVFACISFIALTFIPAAAAQSSGTVTGQVTDGETGRPLPSVNVIVEGSGDDARPRGTSTGPHGRFTVDGLVAGVYTVRARFVGFASRSREVEVSAAETVGVRFALSPRTVGLDAVEVTAAPTASEPAEQLQKADIREANPRDGGELLRTMSGVSAVRRGPVGLDPVVRGLRSGQVGVYVDGMRTFPAGPARMDSPLSHTGPSTMQSIEVAKGPYALTWGGGQLSAIRVETNSLFNVARGERLSGQLQTGYDSNFGSYDVAGTASGRSDAFAYRVDGAYRTGNDYETGDGTSVPADFLNRELRAKIGYKLGENQRLTAGGGYQRQDDVDYPGRLLNAQFFKTGRARLGYEYAPGNGLVRSVEAKAYGYQTLHTMNNDGKVTYASENFPGPPLRVAVNADITTLGGRVVTKLAPSQNLRLKIGADGYRAHRDAERPFEVIMMGRRVPASEAGAIDRYSKQIWPGVSTADAGVFAQATRLLGTVEATGTVRADMVWAGADDEQVTDVYLDIAKPGSGSLDADALDQREFNVSGALMLTAPLSEAWTLSAGGGTAVRSASALERYADRFPSNKAQTSAEFIGNPRLDPERSWQADLELEARYDRVSFTAGGFARRISNYITLQDAPDVEPMLPLPIFAEGPFRYANGTATFYGGEMSASVAVLRSITASVSGSYLWGENLETGQPALGVAPLSGDIGVRYEPPQGRFYVESTLGGAVEQDRVAAVLGETSTEGYVTLDLKGGLTVGRGISVEGGVTNVTNVDHVNHLNAKNPYSGIPIPEAGRIFFAGINYDF
ncbi:TonB-dependent receptor [Salinibacter grassmerensis]|uniref:TonB-dependent receptor n=1 Tax=Salinibacter grassmerensis TaxID=3040353 RepID=UPI0021E77586|nr:TonB-dependent receptor [Salinibacter grassmerensis]